MKDIKQIAEEKYPFLKEEEGFNKYVNDQNRIASYQRQAFISGSQYGKEWISVDERVPDKTGWYLVYDPNLYGDKREVARFDDYNASWSYSADGLHPTHWMLLPSIPGEDKIN